MNKFKKIGLTALAGSLVATSVFAGTLDVSGGASMEVQNNSNASKGKVFTMGNSVNFAGTTELDNGLTVSMKFELDDGALSGAGGPFDSHSMKIASDSLGTFTFHGHGGSSGQSAVDDTATGDFWDNGFNSGTSVVVKALGGVTSATSDNMMTYALPTIMDDVAINTSYVPRGTGEYEASVDVAVAYTGVDGLTVGYAMGEDNATKGSQADVDTMYASYAFSSFTVALTQTDKDSISTATDADREYMGYAITYTANPDLSIKYGGSSHETPNDTTDSDEEVEGITASYTTGGMTISTKMIDMNNSGGVGTNDYSMWELAASFAF